VTRSLDLPSLDRVDTLAQHLSLLHDPGHPPTDTLWTRPMPVVSIHLVELLARSLVQEGHSLLTSGAQGINAAAIRGALAVDPAKLTVILPQGLELQSPESQQLLERVLHLVEKPENDELPLTEASTLCNREIVSRCDQLICFAFHDSETLIDTCRAAEEIGKVVTLLFFD